jgi:hypothetical protein
MNAKSRVEDDMNPVERCRQARRELERQFATAEEYFDWIQRLDKERLAMERLSAKRKAPPKRRPKVALRKKGPARRSAKSRRS